MAVARGDEDGGRELAPHCANQHRHTHTTDLINKCVCVLVLLGLPSVCVCVFVRTSQRLFKGSELVLGLG